MDHHQTHAAKVPHKEGVGEPVQDKVTNQQNLTEIKTIISCESQERMLSYSILQRYIRVCTCSINRTSYMYNGNSSSMNVINTCIERHSGTSNSGNLYPKYLY